MATVVYSSELLSKAAQRNKCKNTGERARSTVTRVVRAKSRISASFSFRFRNPRLGAMLGLPAIQRNDKMCDKLVAFVVGGSTRSAE